MKENNANNNINSLHNNEVVGSVTKDTKEQVNVNTPLNNDNLINISKRNSGNNNKESLVGKSKLGTFGFVLLIFAIIGFVYSLFSSLSLLVLLLYYLVAVFVLILTLTTVNWLSAGEGLAEITNWLFNTVPYVLGVAMGLLLISLLIFIFKKNYSKRKVGIILCIIFIILSIILLVLNLKTSLSIV